jgi:hypothetical protein
MSETFHASNTETMPNPNEAMPPLNSSEYLEQATSLEDAMGRYDHLLTSTVANHEGTFASLNALPEDEKRGLRGPAQKGDYVRETFDTSLKIAKDEVTEVMGAAASTVRGFLPAKDRALLRMAEVHVRINKPESRDLNQYLSKASSPAAKQAMQVALDARILKDTQFRARLARFTGDHSGIDAAINQASSPTAQQAMRAALDGQILKNATTHLRSRGQSPEKILQYSSSATVQEVFSYRLTPRYRTWFSRVESNRTNNPIFGEGVSVDDFLQNLFQKSSSTEGDSFYSYGFDAGKRAKTSTETPPQDFDPSSWYGFGATTGFDGWGSRRERTNTDPEDNAGAPKTEAKEEQPRAKPSPKAEHKVSPEPKVDREVQRAVDETVMKDKRFNWIKGEDPAVIRQVIDDVQRQRRENPGITDWDIYKAARMKEAGQNSAANEDLTSATDKKAVSILDAMMGGDPRRGSLPIEREVPPAPSSDSMTEEAAAETEEDARSV